MSEPDPVAVPSRCWEIIQTVLFRTCWYTLTPPSTGVACGRAGGAAKANVATSPYKGHKRRVMAAAPGRTAGTSLFSQRATPRARTGGADVAPDRIAAFRRGR